MSEAFETLGLPRDASVADVQAARRELAKRHHPDRGGDIERMRIVNDAADRAIREIGRLASGAKRPQPAPSPGASTTPSRSGWSGTATDVPSFTVEALPPETFEALLIVASSIGELVDDDPPYRMEVYLHDPGPSWCRLDLVPDAGSATVSLTVAGLDGAPTPDIDAVRDLWIAELNRLDWS